MVLPCYDTALFLPKGDCLWACQLQTPDRGTNLFGDHCNVGPEITILVYCVKRSKNYIKIRGGFHQFEYISLNTSEVVVYCLPTRRVAVVVDLGPVRDKRGGSTFSREGTARHGVARRRAIFAKLAQSFSDLTNYATAYVDCLKWRMNRVAL